MSTKKQITALEKAQKVVSEEQSIADKLVNEAAKAKMSNIEAQKKLAKSIESAKKNK